jgi:polyphosphate kinase
VFYFDNGGEPEMFGASADWMERNFFRRVEIAFPILRQAHRERILRDLDLCLRDNVQAWALQSDGSYKRVERKPDEKPLISQNELLAIYAAGSNPIFSP